jgi:hypothetical protein
MTTERSDWSDPGVSAGASLHRNGQRVASCAGPSPGVSSRMETSTPTAAKYWVAISPESVELARDARSLEPA